MLYVISLHISHVCRNHDCSTPMARRRGATCDLFADDSLTDSTTLRDLRSVIQAPTEDCAPLEPGVEL
jgi:hypothetical protein